MFTWFQRFIFINHSQQEDNECFHGHAVRLYSGDRRTPYYGAFIDQEMRVRGRYPYAQYGDRAIALPIQWQSWITDAPGANSGGGENGVDSRGKGGEGDEGGHNSDMKVDNLSQTTLASRTGQSGDKDGYNNQPNAHTSFSRSTLVQHHHVGPTVTTTTTAPTNTTTTTKTTTTISSSAHEANTITFRNPMQNPAELERIMRDAHQQPSWKASVIEGESWKGTTQENVNKYLQLLPPADEP
jgi:hypothetical protein